MKVVRNPSSASYKPFDKLDLGDTQVTTQVMTQVDTQVTENRMVTAEQKIIEFREVPRSTKEITEMLGYKERKSAMRDI